MFYYSMKCFFSFNILQTRKVQASFTIKFKYQALKKCKFCKEWTVSQSLYDGFCLHFIKVEFLFEKYSTGSKIAKILTLLLKIVSNLFFEYVIRMYFKK